MTGSKSFLNNAMTSNHTNPTTSVPGLSCDREHHIWLIFCASSFIAFFVGLVAILLTRFVRYKLQHRPRRPTFSERRDYRLGSATRLTKIKEQIKHEENHRWKFAAKVKAKCKELESAQTITGKILVISSFALSIGSLIVYLIDATEATYNGVETCFQFKEAPRHMVDVIFNFFFLFYFFVRFLAADDKLQQWIQLYSFVDYATVPPAFVSIFLNRQWLGFRFLRATRLLSLPDILQYLRVLRTSNSIRFAHLVCMFFGVWLAAAGFVHLAENSGDPFFDFQNKQILTYWECCYFVIVTMSTVGFGDIGCKTVIGRAFITFFILGALATVASCIPEIVEILGRRDTYAGSYDKTPGTKHIVLCGHITYESVNNFLHDFLHEDRENIDIKCVFLDSQTPDLMLQALFKRHFTRVIFLKGTVMNTRDLERVKLREADACLVVANKNCKSPDAEDAANIMRVIAVKNFYPDIPVIIQLMRFHNKAFLVNLPSWTSDDQVVCVSELKLGFVAQSCLAYGFSTLMANLFAMRSYRKSLKVETWQDHYLRGSGMEMYTEYFSRDFVGLSFPRAAELCFTKLKILLIALCVNEEEGGRGTVLLNPSEEYIIQRTTRGFFIGQSEDEVKRVLHYCKLCHVGIKDASEIRQCRCELRGTTNGVTSHMNGNGNIAYEMNEEFEGGFLTGKMRGNRAISISGSSCESSEIHSSTPSPSINSDVFISAPTLTRTQEHSIPKLHTGLNLVHPTIIHEEEESLDSTGLFHWCQDRSFDSCILDHSTNQNVAKSLSNHIVVCLFADHETPSIGLCNFTMPLRASSLRKEELRTIVFIGNETFLRREWDTLCNFQSIYVRLGSPLNRANLRFVRIQNCHVCLVLTPNDVNSSDPYLVDKEAILCSLNVKTMPFNTLAKMWRQSSEQPINLHDFRKMSPKRITKCTNGSAVPIIVELRNDQNAMFLDQDDEDDPDTPLYLTQPFCCGRAFAASVLDSLMSTTYFNRDALNIIRTLITGGATPELEQILAEGIWMEQGEMNADILSIRRRCRITQLPLDEPPLLQFKNAFYGNLFIGALRFYGILCLGIYRLIDPRDHIKSTNRFVITHPPSEFTLRPSDKIYCLHPFEERITMTNGGHYT